MPRHTSAIRDRHDRASQTAYAHLIQKRKRAQRRTDKQTRDWRRGESLRGPIPTTETSYPDA